MSIVYLKYIEKYAKILFIVIVSIVLLLLIYFFRNQSIEIPLISMVIINPLFEFTENLSLKEYLIWYFTIVFAINTIFISIFTYFYVIVKSNRLKNLNFWQDHYSSLIIDYIYKGCVKKSIGLDEFLGKEQYEQLLKELKTSSKKKIFVEVLMHVHDLVDGDLQSKLDKTFTALNLQQTMKYYLLSPYFHERIFAMRALSTFNIADYNQIMYQYTKSKNEILRSEAYIALIKIDEDPLEFLMLYPYNLSEWDKALILDTIIRNRNTPFQLEDLIFSDNIQVSSFAIYIAAKVKRTDLKPIILKKLNHPNEKIRMNVITAIEEMPNDADFVQLIDRYKEETLTIKAQIIKAMVKNTDTSVALAFLTQIAKQGETDGIKALAMEAIEKIVVKQ